MRRSLGKLSHPAIGHTSRKALVLSSPFVFSTHAGNDGGDGGGGRGRGRGSVFPKFSFVGSGPSKSEATNPDDESSFRAPLGHGRGKPLPPPPNVPRLSSSEPPSGGIGTVAGRGRGSGTVTSPPQFEENSKPRTPIFFRKEEVVLPPKAPAQHQPGNQEKSNLPTSILSVLSGVGRGRPTSATTHEASEKVNEINRHIRPRQPVGQDSRPAEPRSTSPKMSREEAVNKAKSVLSRDGDGVGGTEGGFRGVAARGDGGGRGQRGRWSDRGRGRGRGRGSRMSNRDDDDNEEDEEETEVDKANDEKLKKYIGPEKMDLLVQAFEEASANVLPSPEEDAFVDAMHTNLLLECEPEYLMAEFDSNPDTDEKPPISLRDALEKMKPFLMAYENIQTEKEWQDVVEETMKHVPLMKELVDFYSGPNRATAKKQGEELERVAKTLPASAPQSVKHFADRAVLSLQSNPGWGFNRKCQFMDKLVWEVSQSYK
ncbi:hypothetical protein L1987_08061 [Smallanthus sonchifolius]|uniref:Uncharacterized protein n=1 Tax=Smallanthus sonchifolius TaxID=185202 RepID=A0ACB9JKQ3_9ASTR|nr:hypothetical protein L1987_08061 [Smallanthus sonchifolius]